VSVPGLVADGGGLMFRLNFSRRDGHSSTVPRLVSVTCRERTGDRLSGGTRRMAPRRRLRAAVCQRSGQRHINCPPGIEIPGPKEETLTHADCQGLSV
jgi:hypothetical protein